MHNGTVIICEKQVDDAPMLLSHYFEVPLCSDTFTNNTGKKYRVPEEPSYGCRAKWCLLIVLAWIKSFECLQKFKHLRIMLLLFVIVYMLREWVTIVFLHSQKKGSSMVLQNGQEFYLEPFAIWTRLRDLQTMLSCAEP